MTNLSDSPEVGDYTLNLDPSADIAQIQMDFWHNVTVRSRTTEEVMCRPGAYIQEKGNDSATWANFTKGLIQYEATKV